jgi:hypothetical protein
VRTALLVIDFIGKHCGQIATAHKPVAILILASFNIPRNRARINDNKSVMRPSLIIMINTTCIDIMIMTVKAGSVFLGDIGAQHQNIQKKHHEPLFFTGNYSAPVPGYS